MSICHKTNTTSAWYLILAKKCPARIQPVTQKRTYTIETRQLQSLSEDISSKALKFHTFTSQRSIGNHSLWLQQYCTCIFVFARLITKSVCSASEHKLFPWILNPQKVRIHRSLSNLSERIKIQMELSSTAVSLWYRVSPYHSEQVRLVIFESSPVEFYCWLPWKTTRLLVKTIA